MDTIKARELHDQLLVAMPTGARHDAEICSFCVDKSAQTAPVPSGPEAISPDGTEGGTTTAMTDTEKAASISQETHEALLEKALKDATSITEKALETKIQENADLTTTVTTLTEANGSLVTDNARLNSELDTAQVSLKATTDEVASLKQEKADIETAALKADTASKRAEQVKNLGLFEEKYIDEKAAKWADLADADWAERVEEWSARKPEITASTEVASAMEGTSGELTTEHTDEASQTESSRRRVLGL